MISRFVDDCFIRYPSEHRIVVDLQQDNVASWKALEAAGFRRGWAGDLESSDPSDQRTQLHLSFRPRRALTIAPCCRKGARYCSRCPTTVYMR